MSSGRHRLLWQEAEIYLNSQQRAYLLPRAPWQLSVAGGHASHKLADFNLQPKAAKFIVPGENTYCLGDNHILRNLLLFQDPYVL